MASHLRSLLTCFPHGGGLGCQQPPQVRTAGDPAPGLHSPHLMSFLSLGQWEQVGRASLGGSLLGLLALQQPLMSSLTWASVPGGSASWSRVCTCVHARWSVSGRPSVCRFIAFTTLRALTSQYSGGAILKPAPLVNGLFSVRWLIVSSQSCVV